MKTKAIPHHVPLLQSAGLREPAAPRIAALQILELKMQYLLEDSAQLK